MYKLSFIAILEPRISGIGADKVADRLGFDGPVRVDAVGFSGGIWCFWKRRQISIDVVSTSKYCVLLKVNPRSPNPWLLAVLYGSPQERLRDELWTELRGCVLSMLPMICLGASLGISIPSCMLMKNLVALSLIGELVRNLVTVFLIAALRILDIMVLSSLGRVGNSRQRLDRALGNTKWQKAFPFSSVRC